jgi:hypothetical protein
MFLLFGEKQQRTATPLGEPAAGSAARNLSKKRYLPVARIFVDDGNSCLDISFQHV